MKLVQVAERRHCLRFDLECATCVTALAGGRAYECQVAEISLEGLRLRFAGEPPDAERIVIRHPTAGELCALRVWRAGNDLGLAFESSERELEHLLQCISLILNPEDRRFAWSA
ncbi:MAG: PilZ domain-containing protein [Kiloniellales bacterium]|nr:PilZ domain-containing protein [Kiloniellales bacterium]